MLNWFTDAFTKPFAALTLLDLIKALIAWCGSLFFLLCFVAAAVGEWLQGKEMRRVKPRQVPEQNGEALDDQGRPYK